MENLQPIKINLIPGLDGDPLAALQPEVVQLLAGIFSGTSAITSETYKQLLEAGLCQNEAALTLNLGQFAQVVGELFPTKQE